MVQSDQLHKAYRRERMQDGGWYWQQAQVHQLPPDILQSQEQGDSCQESAHARRRSAVQMFRLWLQLCHPQRLYSPQENCAWKRRNQNQILMSDSRLRFLYRKTWWIGSPRACWSPKSGKVYWMVYNRQCNFIHQIHLCETCGRNFLDEENLTKHMASHARNVKAKKGSGSNYDCPHCPR